MLREFRHVGSCLWQRGLVSYRAGNLSVREGGEIIITAKGAPIGFLDEEMLLRGPVIGDVEGASVELPVHQAIYRKRKARAVVHAHPPFAVTLSLLPGDFLPLDTEGALVLGPRIPVVEAGSGSGELAEAVSAALAESLVVLVRGHGCFARSPETLTEAMSIVTTLEASAETKYRSLLLKKL